jgi:hypothetical protein
MKKYSYVTQILHKVATCDVCVLTDRPAGLGLLQGSVSHVTHLHFSDRWVFPTFGIFRISTFLDIGLINLWRVAVLNRDVVTSYCLKLFELTLKITGCWDVSYVSFISSTYAKK